MCTEHGPVDVVVCDVALADVRAGLDGLPVVVTHLPYEGTRVTADPSVAPAFRARLDAALRPHGGGLAP